MKRRSDIVFQAPQKRPRVLDEDEDTGSDDSDAGYELRQMDQSSDEEMPTGELDSISRFKEKDPLQSSPAPTAPASKHASFSDLGISRTLQAALTSMSIRMPTEVQATCIPPLLSGRDCIGNAKTGSGKTITFALPILQKLAVDPYGIFALVLTPTRELAFQISEQFAVLGAALNIRTSVIVGGMDMMAQSLELGNRPHVVIATPGRLVDHLNSGSGEWNLSRVKFLVLDEADRLLTPTFAPELARLFGVLPKSRQTCLFTATMTDSIENLADAEPQPGKQKPFVHRMSETVETVETLKQHYILVPSHVRESYLYYLLCNPPESTLHMRRAPPEPAKKFGKPSKTKRDKKKPTDEEIIPEQPPPTIIFCNRPRTAAYLTLVLKTLSIRSTALHSRLTQRERLSSLSLFRSSVVPVLVSTDVGSRGLDIEDVALVINWDMPMEPEEYTHRVGRTARAGKGGVAISFVTERDEDRVLRIEGRINMQLTEMNVPEARVLEKLNAVSTAKRLANMEIHDSDFGKREKIHKIKQGDSRSDSGTMGK
ncbi:related to ATP-dependent RNA helicase DBP8 [Armillaria ostoyae]|uniref:Related to ATP-dependent RNA helicase DBP8 n=1 Tax=Armillaria ostoyae TaxID=47428 RepID=A0A284QZN3_ARMOS|nr:related to ATP-dependent RNA helicase DBP8 [Armillaria ostoyae]